MSDLTRGSVSKGRAWGGMESETQRDPGSQDGENELHELTSEFLRSQDPQTPDPDVVGRLYIAAFRYIARHFEKRLNDQPFAEDATQEAFKALQEHFEMHQALPQHPMAFLLTAARNWLLVRARNQDRHQAVSLEDVNSSVLDELLDPGAPARQPFEAVASAEIKGIANGALEELDETTREIIRLHREGKIWPEIAQQLGIATPEVARKKFEHAVHHVKAALGEHFSSFVTTAEPDVRRWITSRKSAEQAIDLLPTPYGRILHLLLVEKLTEKEVAARLGVSPEEVRRSRERANELFYKKYRMTEDDLLDTLWHKG